MLTDLSTTPPSSGSYGLVEGRADTRQLTAGVPVQLGQEGADLGLLRHDRYPTPRPRAELKAELDAELDRRSKMKRRTLTDEPDASALDQRANAVDRIARIPTVDRFFENTLTADVDKGGGAPAHEVPFLLEDVVLETAALVRSDELDAAQLLAETLATAQPEYQPGTTLYETLTDTDLPEAVRDERIAALANEANGRLGLVQIELEERARVRRVVAEELWPLLGGQRVDLIRKASAPDEGGQSEPIRISVLTTDLDDDTIAALEAAGLVIDARSSTISHVVGRIAPERLRELALLEVVRRIEPAVFTR